MSDQFKTLVKNRLLAMRRDAEDDSRNHHEGIIMLRTWLRRLHMDLFFEGDLQGASQDEIARQLDENPRGHPREFRVRDRHQLSDPSQSGKPYRAGRSVLQDWTNDLSFMMQSVLICATRGPDGIHKDHPVKVLIRYLRRSFLICAFDGKVRWSPYEPGGGSFTGPLKLSGLGPNEGHLDKYVGIYLRHVDELPHHFQLHLMHAAEILGYKHPDSDVRGFWNAFYLAVVNDAHLRPESEEDMDRRLGDVEAQWREAEIVTAD